MAQPKAVKNVFLVGYRTFRSVGQSVGRRGREPPPCGGSSNPWSEFRPRPLRPGPSTSRSAAVRVFWGRVRLAFGVALELWASGAVGSGVMAGRIFRPLRSGTMISAVSFFHRTTPVTSTRSPAFPGRSAWPRMRTFSRGSPLSSVSFIRRPFLAVTMPVILTVRPRYSGPTCPVRSGSGRVGFVIRKPPGRPSTR